MIRMLKFKRIMCLAMVFCMLFVYVPNISFAKYNMANSYNYRMTVKIQDAKWAGTDNDVYLKVYFHTGKGTFSTIMDTKGHDDFERNSKKSYTYSIEAQPWEISHVEIYNSGGNMLKVEWIKFRLPDGTEIHRDVNQGLEKRGAKYDVTGETKRTVSSAGNFDSDFGKTLYYTKDQSGVSDMTINWNGTVEDNYANAYNAFDYECPPSMSFSANGKGTYQTMKYSTLDGTYLTVNNTGDGYTKGYTLKLQSLLNKMKELGVYKLDITTELKFNSNADNSKTFKKTLTIIRKEFMLGRATVITSPYTPFKDNNFFNADYKELKVEIPVTDKDNYTETTIIKSLADNANASNSKVDIRLYYSKVEEGKYVTPKSISASGKKLVLKFPVPEGYSNNDGNGMTLKMTGLTASENGQTFECSDYTETFDSKYKIDTKGTVFTLKNTSGEAISGFDTYAKSHKFMLDSTKTPWVGGKEAFFSYKLYKTSSKRDEVALSSKYASTATAPHTSSTVYEIKPKNQAEGDFYLEITASDFAGNKTVYGIDTVKLDNIAPRASYKKKEVVAGTSKRLEYNFNIEDDSGSGKLYYCFVKDGDSIPAADASAPENSGTVDTVIGKWAFISQTNADASTVVLNLADGEVFKGKLYYYTADSAGNDSRNESGKGKKNGLWYVDSSLNNENLDCEIVVGDVTPGLPEYDISFTTAAANTVKYRWINGQTTTAQTTYKSENPGVNKHKNGSGDYVTLNGACTLEYTVLNEATGNSNTYTRDFVFDNTKPELTTVVKSGKIGDMRGINVYAKDISNIETLEYKLVNADKTAIWGKETISLSAGLPDVSAEITVAPEKTGAYRVYVKAVDSNGFETEKYSDIFSIRNTAPEINAETDISKSLNGMLVTHSQDYKITANVFEEVKNAEYFGGNQGKQVVKYRVSDDGINYGDWLVGAELKNGDTAFSASVEIDKPLALNVGENKVFIEFVCVSAGEDMKNIPADRITKWDTDILYDAEAPQYNIEFDDLERTTESVTGTITVRDNYCEAKDIKVTTSDWYITIGENPEIIGDEAVYTVEVIENTESTIRIEDLYGNYTEVPLVIDCIDKVAPTVEFSGGYDVYSGERTDYNMYFSVDEAVADKTKLAILKGDFEIGPAPSFDPDNTTTPSTNVEIYLSPDDIPDSLFETENPAIEILSSEDNDVYDHGETCTSYEVAIRGAEEGTYVLVAYVEDSLGNSTKCAVGNAFYINDAEAKIDSAQIIGSENGTPVKVGKKAFVGLTFNVPVYVFPDVYVPEYTDSYANEDEYISQVQEIALEKAGGNVEMGYNMHQLISVEEYGEHTIYFTDECKRAYTGKVTVTENDVTFNAVFPAITKLYEAAEDSAGDTSAWTAIESIDAFDVSKRYFLEIEGDDTYSQLISAEEYSYGFEFMPEHSVLDADSGLYTKAVYEIIDGGMNDITLYYTMYSTDEVGETVETYETYELHITDVTPPEIEYSYVAKDSKDPVNVSVIISDPEAATNPDKGLNDAKEEAGEQYTNAELAEFAGIESVEISDFTEDYPYDYDELTFTPIDPCTAFNIEFEKNGYVLVRATNTFGLTQTEIISVYSIYDNPISEYDYDVEYYYENADGEQQLINEGDSYKSVIAKIVPTWYGEERGLYVSNNMKHFERTLTEYNNEFTFRLRDKYGYIATQTVSYDKFDSTAPVIEYQKGTNAKTNQPIDITVIVSDNSEINSVSLALKGEDAENLTKTGETDEGLPIYTGKADVSGVYTITATDILGNKSFRNFVVNNIDTTLPEVYEKTYTTEEMTNQNVGVKLYYSKSGVELTEVEPAGELAMSDITVDYASSVIRFKENGSVSVKFADEYGNEGVDVVTVDNINRTPPTVEAVAEVSEDLLSVKVTFKQKTDNYGAPIDTMRELSDLNVLYYGISYKADVAEYVFAENGVYTFRVYDSVGNTQIIEVTVDGIDKAAPVITQISWTYDYYDEAGELKNAEGSWTVGDEAGYNVVDDIHKPTNQNVTVNVTTDKETVFVGSGSKDYSTTHSMEYDENGWFNFYLERQNHMMDQYGVGIYLIDKTPPVIEGVEDLIFYENPKAVTVYDKTMLTGFSAYDPKDTGNINLTSSVVVDYGTFNPDSLSANKFDRTKPYEIVYTVKDKVGNETTVKRTITLVGMFDTVMLVNGNFPDSSNRMEVSGDSVELLLQNFSGKAYARYEKGFYTMGEMKHKGTVIEQNGDKFALSGLTEGWYTFYVQTDLRDYFCVNVYILGSK